MLRRNRLLVLREDDVQRILYGHRSGYVVHLGIYVR